MYLIVGCTGQLGQELFHFYKDAIGLKHSVVSIEDPEIIEFIREAKPEVIFNCAAHHVLNDCEINPEKSFDVNAIGPRNLAIAAKKVGAKLVHFSTDYVFDGRQSYDSFYSEEDKPNPINAYGITKLAGEHFVKANCDDYIIARVSALFGKYKCKAKDFNFPQLMIEKSKSGQLNVVGDQYVTPTYTYDLVRQIDYMIKANVTGLYHCTSTDSVSWYEFAKMVIEEIGLNDIVIKRTNTKHSKVLRPMNTSLSSNNRFNLDLKSFMRDARSSVRHYINGVYKKVSKTTR